MHRISNQFLAMAHNNAWANHRLLGAASGLSDAAFGAPRAGFFPSIAATLNHNLTVDWYYVDALERWFAGGPPNAGALGFYDPVNPFPTCGPLREAQLAVDRRLIALCESLRALPTDARLGEPVALVRRVGVVHEVAHRLLTHLFQHAVHHRGQVHAMLSATDVAPPQLDEFFCAGDAPLRAHELAELGLVEGEPWAAPPTAGAPPLDRAPTRAELLAFLRAQPWAVVASVSAALGPEAAVVGVAITDGLELVFDTSDRSRKHANLRARPEIAVVLGWDDGCTVQLEGVVDQPSGAALAELQAVYFRRFPDGRERASWPDIAYHRVRPRWIRFSDFRAAPPRIVAWDPAHGSW